MPTFTWTNSLSSEEEERNGELGYRGPDADHCVLCNRRVNPDKCWQILPCFDEDTIVFIDKKTASSCEDQPELELDGKVYGLQGCYFVGSVCARKIPLAFRWK